MKEAPQSPPPLVQNGKVVIQGEYFRSLVFLQLAHFVAAHHVRIAKCKVYSNVIIL